MSTLSSLLQSHFGAPLRFSQSISGGCIADARLVTLESGRSLFVKQREFPSQAFFREADGLEALAATETLRIPEVLLVTEKALVLEYLAPGPKFSDFEERLGRGLAQMHKTSAKSFGFERDNWLGKTPQPNETPAPVVDWAEFFWTYRLEYQWRLALQKRQGSSLSPWMERLERRLPELLSGAEEPPALLHGDLWSGNVIADESGAPCLVDPAVYFGHREAELGMTTLFGGFSEAFYRAYEEEYPLLEGWRERNDLYQLYHLLNHWNLFGGSYLARALGLLKGLV